MFRQLRTANQITLKEEWSKLHCEILHQFSSSANAIIIDQHFFFNWVPNDDLICFFKKSVDGVLGIRTRGRRLVGADETMELWRPTKLFSLTNEKFFNTHLAK